MSILLYWKYEGKHGFIQIWNTELLNKIHKVLCNKISMFVLTVVQVEMVFIYKSTIQPLSPMVYISRHHSLLQKTVVEIAGFFSKQKLLSIYLIELNYLLIQFIHFHLNHFQSSPKYIIKLCSNSEANLLYNQNHYIKDPKITCHCPYKTAPMLWTLVTRISYRFNNFIDFEQMKLNPGITFCIHKNLIYRCNFVDQKYTPR